MEKENGEMAERCRQLERQNFRQHKELEATADLQAKVSDLVDVLANLTGNLSFPGCLISFEVITVLYVSFTHSYFHFFFIVLY